MDSHLRLLNGNKKVTVIESFNGRASVLLDGKKLEFPSFKEAKNFIDESAWEVSVAFLHGPSIREVKHVE